MKPLLPWYVLKRFWMAFQMSPDQTIAISYPKCLLTNGLQICEDQSWINASKKLLASFLSIIFTGHKWRHFAWSWSRSMSACYEKLCLELQTWFWPLLAKHFPYWDWQYRFDVSLLLISRQLTHSFISNVYWTVWWSCFQI